MQDQEHFSVLIKKLQDELDALRKEIQELRAQPRELHYHSHYAQQSIPQLPFIHFQQPIQPQPPWWQPPTITWGSTVACTPPGSMPCVEARNLSDYTNNAGTDGCCGTSCGC